MTQTNEQAFESYVETILLDQAGWRAGDVAEWDLDRALFPARIFAFLRETQPALWAQMETLHGAGLESLLLNTLVKELDLKGTLHILRRGFKFYGKTFRLAYFKPAHGLNYEIVGLYGKNRLTVTRQVPCHPDKHDTAQPSCSPRAARSMNRRPSACFPQFERRFRCFRTEPSERSDGGRRRNRRFGAITRVLSPGACGFTRDSQTRTRQ